MIWCIMPAYKIQDVLGKIAGCDSNVIHGILDGGWWWNDLAVRHLAVGVGAVVVY